MKAVKYKSIFLMVALFVRVPPCTAQQNKANIIQHGSQKNTESSQSHITTNEISSSASLLTTDNTSNTATTTTEALSSSVLTSTTTDAVTSTSSPPSPFPYNNATCGKQKSCIVGPIDCIIRKNCYILITYYLTQNNTVAFELYANMSHGYIAMGLSNDQTMGKDSVIECLAHNDAKSTVTVHASTNAPRSNKMATDNNSSYFFNVTRSYIDGILHCGFERPFENTVNDITTNLQESKYYILLAIGPLNIEDTDIRYHVDRMTTPYKVNLSSTDFITINTTDSPAPIQVIIHGVLMVAAWIGTASLSIIIARYCKDMEFGKKKCITWFTLHRGLNIITVLFSIVGFVLIFAFAGITGLWQEYAHPSVGTVTFILMFMQIIGAYLRPNPNAPKRFLFNWIHYTTGMLAFIFAIITIFLSVEITASHLPIYYYWILTAFVFFFGMMYAVLHCTTYWKVSVPISSNSDGFQDSTREGNKPDIKRSAIKTSLLIIVTMTITLFTIALIVVTAIGQ